MTIEERVSNLEGAYYQVDQRLTDLNGNMQSLRQEMAGLRREMRQDMTDLRQEVRQDMAEFKQEMRQDMAEIRQDNNALRQEIRQLRTHLYGGIIAIVVAIGASVIANSFIG